MEVLRSAPLSAGAALQHRLPERGEAALPGTGHATATCREHTKVGDRWKQSVLGSVTKTFDVSAVNQLSESASLLRCFVEPG